MQTRPEPRPYQTDGIKFLQDRGRAFLGDEPGLGKTVQALRAASGQTLIAAPSMVLDGGTWSDEVDKWCDTFDGVAWPYTSLNARVKTGTTASSTKPVKVIHEDLKAWGRFETLILDEAHYIKGRNTRWTWAAQQLAKQADQVFLLSGTPIPNWPDELFTALQILFPEQAGGGQRFGSYWRWVEDWFKVESNPHDPNGYAKTIVGLQGCRAKCAARAPTDPCDHYLEFVAENLGDRFLMRLRDDVLTDLPPLTEVEVKVPMTAKQYAAYREMRKTFMTEVDDQEVITWSTAGRHVMLDRITTGLGTIAESPSLAESGKFKRLEYDLLSRSRPTLVVAHYRDSVELAAQVAQSCGATANVVHGGTSKSARSAAVRAFQSGSIDVLCGSLETIAEGLTLTSADQIIRLETSYKPSRNQQAVRRIHRMGQTRPCVSLDYLAVAPNGGATVDGRKRELLARKTDMAMRTIRAAQFKQLL